MCGSMVDIQSARAEIRRGKKKRKKKAEQTTGQKYNGLSHSTGRPQKNIDNDDKSNDTEPDSSSDCSKSKSVGGSVASPTPAACCATDPASSSSPNISLPIFSMSATFSSSSSSDTLLMRRRLCYTHTCRLIHCHSSYHNGNWTTRGYANLRIANSRTGQLVVSQMLPKA